MVKTKFVDTLRDKGLVGAGGAGFPTYFKFSSAKNVSAYVINAAECEPLLFNDQWLMEKKAREIIEGVELGRSALGVERAVIGIKNKYHQAIEALKKQIDSLAYPIDLALMDNFYPAGDEQVMLYEILGKTVPAGGIPIHIGAVVNNVNTAYNIYLAVNDGEPVISRLLTVNGLGLEQPVVMEVPLGVEIEFLLKKYFPESYRLYEEGEAEVIIGGPMMGKLWERDSREVVSKTTGGILFLPVDSPVVKERKMTLEHIIRESKIACCNCSYCTELCPRYGIGHNFKTHLIMQGIAYAGSEFYADYDAAWMCCECGICSMVSCPMNLSPRRVNQFIKSQYKKLGKKPSFPKKQVEPSLSGRKVPYKRLLRHLGIEEFEKEPIYREFEDYPELVNLPLSQHIGAPESPVVKEGAKVKKGDRLTEAKNSETLSVPIHASVKGEIVKVTDKAITIKVEK